MPNDIQAMLARYYGDPSLRESPLKQYEQEGFQPFPPEPPPLQARQYFERPRWRAGDSMVGQIANEEMAGEFGRNLADRNWRDALVEGAGLVAGTAGGKGGRRGAKGSERAAGKAAEAGAPAQGLPERGGVPGGDRGFPAPRGPNDKYTAVPGQPSTVKLPGYGEVVAHPIPQIEAAARDYATSRGRPYEVAAGFDKYDPDRGLRIALAYDAMLHDPHNPEVRRAYEAMIAETMGQHEALNKQGFNFYFNKPGQDPYAKSPALGYLDMRDKGQLYIFPTLEGFGSGFKMTRDQVANNPLLGDSGVMLREGGPKGRWLPATYNDIFRIVHDAYGHNGPGNPFFRAPGEDRAFGHHQILYGDESYPAITAELRGQNSFVNAHPRVAEHNKGASGADTIYADQKVGMMPDWAWKEGLPSRKPGDLTTREMLEKTYADEPKKKRPRGDE